MYSSQQKGDVFKTKIIEDKYFASVVNSEGYYGIGNELHKITYDYELINEGLNKTKFEKKGSINTVDKKVEIVRTVDYRMVEPDEPCDGCGGGGGGLITAIKVCRRR